MNQIEILLRLSENAQDQGDEIAKRQNQERATHISGLLELEKMIELAAQNVRAELGRWGINPKISREPDPMQMPKAAPSFLGKPPQEPVKIKQSNS